MLELGVLARQLLNEFAEADDNPEYCHLFTSEVFVTNQKEKLFCVFLGLSFQFE
jgi:hypothetical protein